MKNIARIDSAQPRYVCCRSSERDLLPLCTEEGIAVIPYNPLAGGLLTGKHDPAAPPAEGTRFSIGDGGRRYGARYWQGNQFETVKAAVTAPIVGASRPVADSLAAAERGQLPVDLKARLAEITQTRAGSMPSGRVPDRAAAGSWSSSSCACLSPPPNSSM